MATKSEWLKNTAALLTQTAPRYDYSTAFSQASAYLVNDAGDWLADSGEASDGEGEPTNGETPSQAAQSIYTAHLNETRTVTISLPVTLDLTLTGSYADGVGTSTILTSLQSQITQRINDMVTSGIDVKTIDFGTATKSFLRTSGNTTAAQRETIQSEIETASNLTDPAAIASSYVRSTYGLDNTWIAEKVYVRSGTDIIVVQVKKYTTTAYSTIDDDFIDGSNTVTYEGYFVFLDNNSLSVQSVIISPKRTTTPT